MSTSTGTDAATILRQSLADLEAKRTTLDGEIDGIEKALAALDGMKLTAWRKKRRADLAKASEAGVPA